jgi:hypothetical protein
MEGKYGVALRRMATQEKEWNRLANDRTRGVSVCKPGQGGTISAPSASDTRSRHSAADILYILASKVIP